jgi:prolyl-tRNA synthetase
MRYSQLFLPTGREIPSDAEVVSHQLMIRAGMIRKLTSGVYSYLPLGYRVIQKVEKIIREEMNRAGAQEVYMPMVQPRELWEESGRWQHYGKELLRFRDRHDRDCCLGPTHEEVITDLVRNEIRTYRHLPKNFYQIQTKFRDEIRPRFGVMRCREFAMKDAYSFDMNEAGVDESYRKMYDAYTRIFERCGLTFRAVEADTGSIGGSFSHEFMVIADTGEDALVFCTVCEYAANLEKAEIARPEKEDTTQGKYLPVEAVHTPGMKSIEEVCGFLNMKPEDIVKMIIYSADGVPVAVLVRGDVEINEVKVKNFLGCDLLEKADEEMIYRVTGAPRGYAGAVGINVKIIADYSLLGMSNFVTGANREDYHLINVNVGRDFTVGTYADIRFVRDTDCCPRCKGMLKFARGIEVGHVFKLGTKYSKTMKATYLDRNGQERFMEMGCYGIGIGRTVAAAIEQHYDENGIVWPVPIAPFQVIITPVNVNDHRIAEISETLYASLLHRGVDTLLDDRDERAGVKFKDADLIGIPLRVTVGQKSLVNGVLEVKIRKTGEVRNMPQEELEHLIVSFIHEDM